MRGPRSLVGYPRPSYPLPDKRERANASALDSGTAHSSSPASASTANVPPRCAFTRPPFASMGMSGVFNVTDGNVLPMKEPPPILRLKLFHFPMIQFSADLNASLIPSKSPPTADLIRPGRPLMND